MTEIVRYRVRDTANGECYYEQGGHGEAKFGEKGSLFPDASVAQRVADSLNLPHHVHEGTYGTVPARFIVQQVRVTT